tara:strand:+ start:297 stop:503 length:207 start_codon:yes stop_codon:yes gene_type:complete
LLSIDLIAGFSTQNLAKATREDAAYHPMEKMSDRRTKETALGLAALYKGDHCDRQGHGETPLIRFFRV